MKKNNRIPKDMKNLQRLYDTDDILLINELRHNPSKRDRNLCIGATILGLVASGASFTLCRDNVINGMDVFAVGCSIATIVSGIGIIVNQSIINNNGRTR